jgi:hypothetical protein
MSTEDCSCHLVMPCDMRSQSVCDPDSLEDVIQLLEESGIQFLKNSFDFLWVKYI